MTMKVQPFYRLLSFLLLFSLSTLYSFVFSQNTLSPLLSDELNILTWNVKLLPRIAVFLHHHPIKRAKLIPTALIESKADVIVLEEAFDGRAIHILKKKLQVAYPYCIGQKNKAGVRFKKAGGVLLFSKYPTTELESIRYSQCNGFADCQARKGALLVEVNHPIGKIQVLGTHIQAGGAVAIKQNQFIEIAALLKKHEKQHVPQFIAGDFNTKKTDSILYPILKNCLMVEDGEICCEQKFSSDHLLNDMYDYDPEKRRLIDYIFIKPNDFQTSMTKREILIFKNKWHKKHKDLSDHYAVKLSIKK